METLRSQPRNCVKLAFSILFWLVKARRVLTVRELQIAVSIGQDWFTLDLQDLPNKKTILDVWASLVTIDDTNDMVRLAHYTIQEYLLKHSILPSADFQLAMACVILFSIDVYAQDTEENMEPEEIWVFPEVLRSSRILMSNETRHCLYPFIGYAARNLSFHLNACDEVLTTELALRFLKNPGNMLSFLGALDRWFTLPLENMGKSQHTKAEASLCITLILGHCSAFHLLFEDINIVTTDGMEYSLQLAVYYSQSSIWLGYYLRKVPTPQHQI
jgi:hypothetical protein